MCTSVDLEKDVLMSNLKQFCLRNKINVKIHEVTNHIEVLDEDFDVKMSVVDMKKIYSNVKKFFTNS